MIALTTDLKRLGAVQAPAGFADRVLAQVGMADSYARFETVLGDVFVAWNRLGVSAAARSASADEFEEWFRKDVGRPLVAAVASPELAEKIQDELSGKKRMRFDLRGLTAFEQAVLRKTREIPRGEVRPYGWVAREIGRFGVDRAVVGDAGAEGVAVHHPRELAIEEEKLLMSDNLRVQVVRQVAVQCTLHVGTSEPEARA